jgi:putative (di)nucleoside polyphosphate hydrolase
MDEVVWRPFSAWNAVGEANATMIDLTSLPYRPNVGAVLFNRLGQIFVARRADVPNAEGAAGGWQLPQGGIDAGEDPRLAVLRELQEEIGTNNVRIMAEHPDWLSYDLPPELLGRAWGGRYRGQTQRWFALRFLGEDAEIRLDLDPHPEFDSWRWAELRELPAMAVGFKRAIYDVLARSFAGLAMPEMS